MSLFERFLSPGDPEPDDPGEPDAIRLVVGLGNPGLEYEGTRHNIGFDLVDRLASARGWKWRRDRKLRAKVATDGGCLVLAKPLTFMNLSGNAVARIARRDGLAPAQVLVAYDDADLPLGRIRFRASGSAGGHNGIKSLIEYLGTRDFPRLKIGIGGAEEEDMVGHVLGKFRDEEREDLEKVLANAEDGVNCTLSSGLVSAMNRFN